MFNKDVYVRRRRTLLDKMKDQQGVILLLGNVDAPAQYPDNCYKFRQNSTWLYYFGIDEARYAAVIDIATGRETIFADDVDIDDIIWTGPMPSVASVAESVGVQESAPYAKVFDAVKGVKVHTIPATRYYNQMVLKEMGITQPSLPLIDAIVSMRLVKEDIEIAEIDAACVLGQEMHTIARNGIRLGRIEQEIVGEMEGVTLSKGWGISFPTILTQHGEIFHCHSHDKLIEPGRLMVIDAGAESNSHYASDFTRTYPTGGKFTQQQREIYQLVYDCNELAFSLTAPGVTYRSVHLAVAEKMLAGLKDIGLVQGDVPEMVELGIAGLFMPHGLGHNMGMDVHDMEDLGEDRVGYDPDQQRSSLLGLRSLRMARRLVPGNVITDEPGIYFIPDLIRKWQSEGTDKGHVNYKQLENYFNFGGIRLEDDVLVTETGARRMGGTRLPIAPDDVEKAMLM